MCLKSMSTKPTTITQPTDPQRIATLEAKVAKLEEQLLVCMRWMRREAEKEALLKDPNFKPLFIASC